MAQLITLNKNATTVVVVAPANIHKVVASGTGSQVTLVGELNNPFDVTQDPATIVSDANA